MTNPHLEPESAGDRIMRVLVSAGYPMFLILLIYVLSLKPPTPPGL